MGRGRQKAKHTKLARELKSYSPEVDYGALERELAAKSHTEEDEYAQWAAHNADEDYSDYSSRNGR